MPASSDTDILCCHIRNLNHTNAIYFELNLEQSRYIIIVRDSDCDDADHHKHTHTNGNGDNPFKPFYHDHVDDYNNAIHNIDDIVPSNNHNIYDNNNKDFNHFVISISGLLLLLSIVGYRLFCV